jgi:hypothetical protein
MNHFALTNKNYVANCSTTDTGVVFFRGLNIDREFIFLYTYWAYCVLTVLQRLILDVIQPPVHKIYYQTELWTRQTTLIHIHPTLTATGVSRRQARWDFC